MVAVIMELKTAISLILAPATFGREFADARAETPVQPLKTDTFPNLVTPVSIQNWIWLSIALRTE